MSGRQGSSSTSGSMKFTWGVRTETHVLAWTARPSHCTGADAPACRCIFVSNHLPLKVSKSEAGEWQFEWDDDALLAQAKVRTPSGAVCLPGRQMAAGWTIAPQAPAVSNMAACPHSQETSILLISSRAALVGPAL